MIQFMHGIENQNSEDKVVQYLSKISFKASKSILKGKKIHSECHTRNICEKLLLDSKPSIYVRK